MKKYFTLLMIIILLIGCSKKVEEKAVIAKTPVEVLLVKKIKTNSTNEFSGILQPVSTVQIFPEVVGKITKILVDEGEMVKMGTALAQIEKTDYIIGLEQAKAVLQLAEAGYKNSKLNLDRQKKLEAEGFSSEATIDGVQTAYDVAKAQLNQAKAGYKMAKRQVDRTVIKAPISGYISAKLVDKGQMAVNSAPAFVIQNIKTLKLNLSVSAKEIQNISLNSNVVVHLSNDDKNVVNGKIVFVGKTSSPDGGYPIKVEVDNTNLKLLAGESVKIFIAQPAKEYVVIPEKAIEKKDGYWSVSILKNDTIQKQQVSIKGGIRGETIVENGLNVDDMLVVRGQEYCSSGDQVEVTKVWKNIEELTKKKVK